MVAAQPELPHQYTKLIATSAALKLNKTSLLMTSHLVLLQGQMTLNPPPHLVCGCLGGKFSKLTLPKSQWTGIRLREVVSGPTPHLL